MSVSVSFDLPAILERMRPKVQQVVEAQAAALAEGARASAPVRTGRYRDSIAVEAVEAGPDVVARKIVTVGYARFIRSNKTGKQQGATRLRFVLTSDLGNPWRAQKKEFSARVAKAAADAVGG